MRQVKEGIVIALVSVKMVRDKLSRHDFDIETKHPVFLFFNKSAQNLNCFPSPTWHSQEEGPSWILC